MLWQKSSSIRGQTWKTDVNLLNWATVKWRRNASPPPPPKKNSLKKKLEILATIQTSSFPGPFPYPAPPGPGNEHQIERACPDLPYSSIPQLSEFLLWQVYPIDLRKMTGVGAFSSKYLNSYLARVANRSVNQFCWLVSYNWHLVYLRFPAMFIVSKDVDYRTAKIALIIRSEINQADILRVVVYKKFRSVSTCCGYQLNAISITYFYWSLTLSRALIGWSVLPAMRRRKLSKSWGAR